MLQQLSHHRYTIQDELGKGAMGVVYRAIDRLNGETVALKQVNISPQHLVFSSRPITEQVDELRLALAREFQTLASLRHPHIISVLDYGFSQAGQPFFTMTLLDNPQTIISYGKVLSTAQKAELLLQMLQALTYLHRREMLHRDVKPANVLVNPDGQVKLLDFGLSATTDQAKGVVGTLAYMAPEVLRGGAVNFASDIYAAGMVAYELFIGIYPFNKINPTRLMAQIMSQEPDFSALNHPALEAVLMRWLHKDPDQRYQAAEAVMHDLCRALAMPLPAETHAIRESFLQSARFIGREHEFDQLLRAFDQTQTGQGAIWLIGGESGVGKSRLMDEIRIHALTRGVIVLNGEAVESGGLPYQLWRDVLPKLLLNVPIDPAEASVLKEIVPNIAQLVGYSVPDAPKIEVNAQKLRLQITLNTLFKRQTAPMVLLLDDLQWATASLDLLRGIMGLLADLPLFIIGTYRDDERPQLPDELGIEHLIRLNRFDKPHIQALSSAMLGDVGDKPDVVDLLNQETEGNIFFLIEVVRALAEEAGHLSQIGIDTLPESVFTGGIYALVARRLSKLPDDLQPITQLAAVMGREVDWALLAHHYPSDILDDWLSASASAMILEIRDNKWRFAHDKLREGALYDMPSAQRIHLHQHAANAIEAVYPNNPDYDNALLEHWHHVGNTNKAVHYLEKVVLRMLDTTGVNKRTYHILDRTVSALSDDDVRRPLLFNLYARAYFFASKFDQAHEYASQAHQLAGDNDRLQVAESLYVLGNVASRRGDFAQAEAHLGQAITIWEAYDNLLGVARNTNTIGMLYFRQGQPDKARTYFERAHAIYLAHDDKHGLATTYNYFGYVCIAHNDYEGAKNYYLQSLPLLKAIGDIRGTALLLGNIGWVLQTQAHYHEAIDYYSQSLELAHQSGNRHLVTVQLQELGSAYSALGDFAKGMTYFTDCLSIRREIGDTIGIAYVLNEMSPACYRQGDYESAYRYADEALQIARNTGEQNMTISGLQNLGIICAMQNDIRAKDYFIEGLELAYPAQDMLGIQLCVLGMGWVYLRQNQSQLAGELIGLIQNQPQLSSSVLQHIDDMMPTLKNIISEDDLMTSMAHGKQMDINEVAQRLLAEFSSSTHKDAQS